jgi:uncharacterized membrane protein
LTMLPLAGVGQMLAMLGRNSLLVFLAHRLILQVQVHTVMGVLNPQVAGPLMTVITALLLLAACRIREATPALSTRLKRVGL